MKLVESIKRLAEELSEIELSAEFQQALEESGFYDPAPDVAVAEARPSSRPMTLFKGNPDAQKLMSYLHRKNRLSSRASFEAHDKNQRLPWRELKQSPDSYIMFFGPNGMAAAHPRDSGDVTDREGVSDQGRALSNNLIYEVYYLLNDREDIFMDVYETRRGGLPNKRDQRNPDNIADFIRDKLGVRGSFPAIYISGPKDQSADFAEPITDDDLRQQAARLQRQYRQEEQDKDPAASDEEIQQRVDSRVRDTLKDNPDLRKRIDAAIDRLKQDPDTRWVMQNQPYGRRQLVRRELSKQGLDWIYSGRRSLARTKPGTSVERGKVQMRKQLQSSSLDSIVDRFAKAVPQLINQWKVKKIRSGQRADIEKLPSDIAEQYLENLKYNVSRTIEDKAAAEMPDTGEKISALLSGELDFFIKDKKLKDQILDIYRTTGNADVPDELKQRDIAAAKKIQHLLRSAIQDATNEYRTRRYNELVSQAATGSRSVLNNLLNDLKGNVNKYLDRAILNR